MQCNSVWKGDYFMGKQEKQFEGKGWLGFGKCHYKVGLTDQAIDILEASMKEVIKDVFQKKNLRVKNQALDPQWK